MDTSYRDTAVELKVIAYAVRKGHKICEEMNRDFFSIKSYRLFFDIVSTERTTHPREVMKDKIAERLKKPEIANPYLIKIYKHNLANITHKSIMAMVAKLGKLAALRIALEKTEDLLTSAQGGKIDEVRKIARQIANVGINRKRVYTGEYLRDFEERERIVKQRMLQQSVGVPIGVKKFDLLSGGLLAGELGIVVGESGIGKSICLENFGIHAWELDLNVLYVTIEMPKTQVQFRMDSRLTRLLYSKFRKGEFAESELNKWKKRINDYRKSKKNYFEVVSLPRGCSANGVEVEAERVQDIYGKKLDLIIVDYLNIMKPNAAVNSSGSRDWKNQVDIAWELKEIATDFCDEGIPLWTGNQITDEAEGAALVQKKHIKYGRGIVEVANVVVALVQSEDDLLEDIMQFQVVKVRDLDKMTPITLRPNYDIMVLNDEARLNTKKSLSTKRKFK